MSVHVLGKPAVVEMGVDFCGFSASVSQEGLGQIDAGQAVHLCGCRVPKQMGMEMFVDMKPFHQGLRNTQRICGRGIDRVTPPLSRIRRMLSGRSTSQTLSPVSALSLSPRNPNIIIMMRLRRPSREPDRLRQNKRIFFNSSRHRKTGSDLSIFG